METRGGRGREGISHARQGRSRGNQNRQLNCRRRSSLSCRPQPSQELPGKSRWVQSRWLNHRWRSRLATGAQIRQPGRPGSGLDRNTLPIRLPLGRQKLEVLFLLQLRLSRRVQRWFPSSRWPRNGRHHRRCLPRRSRAHAPCQPTIADTLGYSPKPDQGEV